MKVLILCITEVLIDFIRALRPGGVKALIAEKWILRHQLAVISRKYEKAPPLQSTDRLLLGFFSFLVLKRRLSQCAILIKPATILRFHKALVKRKYGILFGSKHKTGRQGFSQEIKNLVIEIKRKNPRYGCPKIALTVTNVTGISISEHTVRRILRNHYKPTPGSGPSWLSFLGSMKDSLWSLDFFRCESIFLRTHWVMVVMDQYTRRIIGFSVHSGSLNGPAICSMFNRILAEHESPKRLSADNDPLFKFHRWIANLSIAEIEPIKTLPDLPISHPYVERLIGTVRREYLDHILFLNARDLEEKLEEFVTYYNGARVHYSLEGRTPAQVAGELMRKTSSPSKLRWKSYCNDLFHVPFSAQLAF